MGFLINFAHRGASGRYPENTILAFEKALEFGANGIETDVQMTKDGILVLMHDEMVNRTTDGIGFVKDYTFSEIKKLDAGSWFSKEYLNEKVPSVEELLLLVKGKKVVVNFEIKNTIIEYEGIEEKLLDLIYRYGMQKNVIISSFNHYSVVRVKKLSSEIKTGLLYMENLYCPEKYAKYVGVDALHPYFYSLGKDVVGQIKKEDIMINTFTVNDTNYMKYLMSIGVDGIITNYPEKLNKLMINQREAS
nr:glycerophosphodiester phosphodiesterase [Caloramator proteoclasticus]